MPDQHSTELRRLKHFCGVAETGRVYCWGLNFYGELGVERSFTSVNSPVRALAGSDYERAIAIVSLRP